MLDHYYEDFEGTETASLDFDNMSTSVRDVEREDSNVAKEATAGEMTTSAASATADVGTTLQSLELPMTEQNFRTLTHKVN